jgi:hypothetical protein
VAKQNKTPWSAEFMRLSPMFYPLAPAVQELNLEPQRWPTLGEYADFLQGASPPIKSHHGALIRPVAQDAKPHHWQADYEPRIYLKGELQTRTENWHDFFQILVWRTFPRCKSELNALHYHAIEKRLRASQVGLQRSRIENALTQFDECGAIVVSSDSSLLDLIRRFRWKELFWNRRHELNTNLRCYIFGHATYEKALQPYVGLTAHALLFTVSTEWFTFTLSKQLAKLDELCAQSFSQGQYTSPQEFSPFPLLGMPLWDADNASARYYENKRYFREGRRGANQ